MKKNYLLLYFLFCSSFIFSQNHKNSLDPSKRWGRINSMISNDGNYFIYTIKSYPKSADDELVVRSTSSGWKKEIKNFTHQFQFTGDSKKMIFLTEGDSIGVITLGSEKTEYLPNAQSFKLLGDKKKEWIAYKLKNENTIILKGLDTNKELRFSNTSDFVSLAERQLLVLKREYSENNKQELVWVNLEEKINERIIWTGKDASNIILNQDGTKLAFIAKEGNDREPVNTIWYYKAGEEKAVALLDDHSPESENLFTITQLREFNTKENSIVCLLTEKPKDQPRHSNEINVDVWSYTDPRLQSNQLWQIKSGSSPYNPEKQKINALRLGDHKMVQLERHNEEVIGHIGDYALVFCKGDGDVEGEWNWNRTASVAVDLVNIKEGLRKRIFDKIAISAYSDNSFMLSPDEKYVIYFDPQKQHYFSYQVATGVIRCITANIQAEWTSHRHRDEPDAAYRPINVSYNTIFINSGKDILLYSRTDLFQVDISGEKPAINLTNGYGKKNDIAFRLLFNNEEIKSGDRVILNAFDRKNNNNGFYYIVAGKRTNPVLLSMQPYMLAGPDESNGGPPDAPKKARDANVYLVLRQKASESPNIFLTRDFQKFAALSNYHPERKYNWLTSELHRWKGLNGDSIKGILYKPENFDSSKKYPVIFYYYEKLSEELHRFIHPEYSYGVLNIPFFVTNGYLVFVPDIPKIMGHPGPSAVNAVVSAAKYLSDMPWVDPQKLGIQGHSFGGFETNYILTHSDIFAAAMSSSSMSNFISVYNSVNPLGDGSCRQRQFEIYHDAIGASMWQRPDLYIENAPVLYAHKVTTPLLMMNNISDGDVPFAQGIEFFTALRRLGKRVWMLQYDGADHIILGEAQAKDFTWRMKQFFDHYLMDKPAPVWMTRGIPARHKGIKDGLEYDTEIKTPGEGLLLPEEKQRIDSFKYRKPFAIVVP